MMTNVISMTITFVITTINIKQLERRTLGFFARITSSSALDPEDDEPIPTATRTST